MARQGRRQGMNENKTHIQVLFKINQKVPLSTIINNNIVVKKQKTKKQTMHLNYNQYDSV